MDPVSHLAFPQICAEPVSANCEDHHIAVKVSRYRSARQVWSGPRPTPKSDHNRDIDVADCRGLDRSGGSLAAPRSGEAVDCDGLAAHSNSWSGHPARRSRQVQVIECAPHPHAVGAWRQMRRQMLQDKAVTAVAHAPFQVLVRELIGTKFQHRRIVNQEPHIDRLVGAGLGAKPSR